MDGDLISRRAMLEAIDKRERITRKYVPDVQEDELRPTLKSIREFVNKRPAVDAEPVRHGQWKAANRRGTLCDTYVCSECGNMVMQAEGYTYSCTYNYCPNCGAKMDEEDMKDGETY